MPFFNYLLISVLLVSNFPFIKFGFDMEEHCPSLQVSYEVTVSEPGSFNVVVKSKSGVSPIQYLFYSDEGKVLSTDMEKSTLKGVSRGKYYCIVRDAKKCRETIEIEIK
jgi:hypothetical protein